jgi:hypothetical protein
MADSGTNPFRFAPTHSTTGLQQSASPIEEQAGAGPETWMTETTRLQRSVHTAAPVERAAAPDLHGTHWRFAGDRSATMPTSSVQQGEFHAPPAGWRAPPRATADLYSSKFKIAGGNSDSGVSEWQTSTSRAFALGAAPEPLERPHPDRHSQVTIEHGGTDSDHYQTASKRDFVPMQAPTSAYERRNPNFFTSQVTVIPSGSREADPMAFQSTSAKDFAPTGVAPVTAASQADTYERLRKHHFNLGKDSPGYSTSTREAYENVPGVEHLAEANRRPNPELQNSHFSVQREEKLPPPRSMNQVDFPLKPVQADHDDRKISTQALQASHFTIGSRNRTVQELQPSSWQTHSGANFQPVDTRKHAPQRVSANWQSSSVLSHEEDKSSHGMQSVAKTAFIARKQESLPHVRETGKFQQSHFSLGDTKATKPEESFKSHLARDFAPMSTEQLRTARGAMSTHNNTQTSTFSVGGNVSDPARFESVSKSQFGRTDLSQGGVKQEQAERLERERLSSNSLKLGDGVGRYDSEAASHFVKPSPRRIPRAY